MKTANTVLPEFGVHVILNNGWKSEAFLLMIASRLCGESFCDVHPISERSPENLKDGWTRQLIGFGGEQWRGMAYYNERGVAAAVKLIPNFDTITPNEVAFVSIGLAIQTSNGYALNDKAIPFS